MKLVPSLVSVIRSLQPVIKQYAMRSLSSHNPDFLQCEELSAGFGTALHYPEDDNIMFWDARQQAVRPACRVEPSSAANVSSIMTILVNNGCRFAVKCGGHSRHEDDSNSVGGVTVDLGRMNTVMVTENNTAAVISGGATSHQIYSVLEPFNLSFVGGRTGSVGVGGFTLGGGTSPLSPRWGWALDNIFEYEVCVAVLLIGLIR